MLLVLFTRERYFVSVNNQAVVSFLDMYPNLHAEIDTWEGIIGGKN